jgi:hypothetical protein
MVKLASGLTFTVLTLTVDVILASPVSMIIGSLVVKGTVLGSAGDQVPL